MNILISYNWIREFVRTKLSPEEFAARVSLCGPSVERVYPQGENLENVFVGEVLKISPHPNADKLRVADVALGKTVKKIVCGGINLREGMKIAAALPGAKVRWHGEGELVELKPAEIRGVKSEGMICAASEIGLFDYFPHSEREIMDISFISAPRGAPLREALGIEDFIFDIEVTTNRIDAFGTVGFAREAAAILGEKFFWKEPKPPAAGKGEQLKIKVESRKLCPRYQAAVLRGAKIKPSPWWMQKRLISAGFRPINNIVDITNYIMLEFGQPMHGFDADLALKDGKSPEISVRAAAKGEKIFALDGETYVLDPSMLVIAASRGPIAIAGVIGGENAGITADTKRIIFESANFDPVSVRRTARALNLRTESALRFEKGLSTEFTGPAIFRAIELARELAGAELASSVFDERKGPYIPLEFRWDTKESAARIGARISAARSKALLVSLGFEILGKQGALKVRVPYWRDHDIESSADFTEEIARLYGYHNLPSVIPCGEIPLPDEDDELSHEDELRDALCGAGFFEAYSYSMVSKDLLAKARHQELKTLAIQNPLTEDLALMRPSLVPSMLEIIALNEGLRADGAVFEIANVYMPRKDELPDECPMLSAAVWGAGENGEQFFRLKGILDFLARRFSVTLEVERGKGGSLFKFTHPARSAVILAGGREMGWVAEVHPLVREEFGIKKRCAVLYADPRMLMSRRNIKSYKPLPEFPPVRRDISFFVDSRIAYKDIARVIYAADPLLMNAELFDVYEGREVPSGKKSMAWRLEFSDPSRTLTGEEADIAFGHIVEKLKQELGAEVRMQAAL